MKHVIETTSLSLSRRDFLRWSGLAGVGLAVPGLLAACGSGNSGYAATIVDARIAVLQALTDSGTPSVSVALMDRDRVIWAEAFGVIDKVNQTAPTTETLYCFGSCSKMIATLAVLLLVERGKLELDAPLVQYLPGFSMASPEYTQITVRMLINHSSGFPGSDYRGAFSTAPYQDYAVQVMQTLATVRLKHAPGAMSVYCNDGFTMVEPLVAALTGLSYPQFVGQEILTPLGMLRSRFALEPFAAGSFAPGFDGNTKLGQEFVNPYASGGLYTTPSEMGRLTMLLLNNGQLGTVRLLQAATVAEMARNQTLTQAIRPVAMEDGYGLGWDGVRQGGLAAVGVTAWHKNGGTSVYGSDVFVLPQEGLALTISGTSSAYGSGVLAERILMNALIERGRLTAMPTSLPATPQAVATATDAQLADMAGIYAYYQGLLRIQVQADGTLALSKYATGGWSAPAATLIRRADGTFSSDAAPLTAYYSAASQGERYLAVRLPQGLGHYQFEIPYAQRLGALAPLSVAWLARLGRKWLAVNEPFESIGLAGGGPVFTLASAPDLPGYVLASAGPIDKSNQIADASTSDSAARMCLKIPFVQSRDLDDVLIELRKGEEWVRVGSSVFRPQLTVPVLALGSSQFSISAEGYAEWRQLAAAATLSISGNRAWKLFDSDFQLLAEGLGGVKRATPAGACLLLYGAPGAVIALSVTV